MENVKGNGGGDRGVNGEGNAGEIDQCCDYACDQGGVAGVLFCRLDEAAEAVVIAADFLADALEQDFPEGGLGGIKGGNCAEAISIQRFPGLCGAVTAVGKPVAKMLRIHQI
jgi:hypothetical protein